MKQRAYIDIETTGLSRYSANLTVVGIGLESGNDVNVIQLIDPDISDLKVLAALQGAGEIYSYNGSRFDLPFIKAKLGLDLKSAFRHTDLMYDCWKHNLKGGLKVVETRIGIYRKLKDIDGAAAVRLWWEYLNNLNKEALAMLLAYNREDVVNLRFLREKLGIE